MIRIGFYCFQACFKIPLPLLQFAFSDPLSKNLKTLSIVKRQYRIYKHLTSRIYYIVFYIVLLLILVMDIHAIATQLLSGYMLQRKYSPQLGLCWEMWMWKMYRRQDKSNVNAITLLCFSSP